MSISFCMSALVVLLAIVLTFSLAERYDMLPPNSEYLQACFSDCEAKRQDCLKATPTGNYCDFANEYCIQNCVWTAKFK